MLLPAQSLPARQASQPLAVSLRAWEPAPWIQVALWLRAIQERLVWPPAQQEPQVRSVSLLQARRWLPEASLPQRAASAQPLPLHP